MRKSEFRISGGVLLAVLLLIACRSARAHETDEIKIAPGEVALQFIPPPMSGTISLGIYDARGKLVRVLHNEAEPSEFVAGLNGFITKWDGKDDARRPVAPGKYSARGYVVGNVSIEGLDFHFNAWAGDDEPLRIRRVRDIRATEGTRFVMVVTSAGDADALVCYDCVKGPVWRKPLPFGSRARLDLAALAKDVPAPPVTFSRLEKSGKTIVGLAVGQFWILRDNQWQKLTLPALSQAIDFSFGGTDDLWVIDKSPEKVEVKQFSLAGEFKRVLPIEPGQPAPVKVSAANDSDRIYLLEENSKLQRVRALTHIETNAEQNASTWRTDLEKTIEFSDTFGFEDGALKAAASEAKLPRSVKVQLAPNPLAGDKAETLEIQAACDATSSFLRTADGLPLKKVSETRNLRRLLFIARPGNDGWAMYQSDGAAVEEFKITNLQQIMAFDCGDFDWKGAPKAKN